MNEQQFNNQLKQFTGSEYLYKYILGLKISEGVKFASEAAQCWWYIDIIASYQIDEGIREQEFQTWTLTVENSKGVVIATDGNRNELIRQNIPYTDFEYSELTYWCVNGIILLATEY